MSFGLLSNKADTFPALGAEICVSFELGIASSTVYLAINDFPSLRLEPDHF